MSAKEIVRRNKTTIQSTLCGDHQFILNKVYENEIITLREYNNLRNINRENVEGHVVELVDKIMNKGDASCQNFLSLLQTDDDIKETFPELQSIPLNDIRPLPAPVQASSTHSGDLELDKKIQKRDDLYQLQSQPVGLCVIINNENFTKGKQRPGTENDAQSLAEVFSWLGFTVLMFKDQTKDEMEQTMTWLASPTDVMPLQKSNVQEWSRGRFVVSQRIPRHGDAFICCILSHGQKGAVLGTDGNPLYIKQITRIFKGTEQSPLTGKPKVFLIQACQGCMIQKGVLVQGLESDDSGLLSIPEEADYLVAVATVEDHVSFRHRTNGSWFIQSLCQQLKEHCPRGEDINFILQYVNGEVSKKEASSSPGEAKQIPEVKYTLRKRLVLSPHHTSD
ncbi:caspase-8-like [Melanotaenia boesemani]|uniref:caspase-8-like n=1 Tax=Melanotaenia boesemani TaxID=1250792 RepID=UPI001C058F31|nr:caspase-8-like [Melanotaenia boesemani]